MNERIRTAIRKRALLAVTNNDLVQAIFDGYHAESIEPQSISLEDMKVALVFAARAARGRLPVAA